MGTKRGGLAIRRNSLSASLVRSLRSRRPAFGVLASAPDEACQMSTGTSIATAHVSGVVALMLESDSSAGGDADERKINAVNRSPCRWPASVDRFERLAQERNASQVDGIAPKLLIVRAGHEQDRKVQPVRSKLAGQINPRRGAKLNIEHQACRFRRIRGAEELGSRGV